MNLEGKVIPAPINRINHPNLSDSLPNAAPDHPSLIAAGPSAGLRLAVKGQLRALPLRTTHWPIKSCRHASCSVLFAGELDKASLLFLDWLGCVGRRHLLPSRRRPNAKCGIPPDPPDGFEQPCHYWLWSVGQCSKKEAVKVRAITRITLTHEWESASLIFDQISFSTTKLVPPSWKRSNKYKWENVLESYRVRTAHFKTV